MQKNHYLVPAQLTGLEKNITYSIAVKTIEDAEDWFVDAKERLLDVNNWRKYDSGINLDFRLTDLHGQLLNRKAHNGDHIRIDAQGRETDCDWLTIEALEYDDYPDIDMETFAMRVRSCEDPAKKQEGFTINDTTTTIVVERIGKKLSASYHGRNESGNDYTDHEPETQNNIAWLGLSDVQWANFLKSLID